MDSFLWQLAPNKPLITSPLRQEQRKSKTVTELVRAIGKPLYGRPILAARAFTSDASQPQSPPHPGFFRFMTARSTSHVAETATRKRAAKV